MSMLYKEVLGYGDAILAEHHMLNSQQLVGKIGKMYGVEMKLVTDSMHPGIGMSTRIEVQGTGRAPNDGVAILIAKLQKNYDVVGRDELNSDCNDMENVYFQVRKKGESTSEKPYGALAAFDVRTGNVFVSFDKDQKTIDPFDLDLIFELYKLPGTAPRVPC